MVLDEQLAAPEVVGPLAKRYSVTRVQELRSRELIRDERLPSLLLEMKEPTLVTIDHGFFRREWSHPKYCILVVAVKQEGQEQVPELVRAALNQPEFRTRRARMGKVIRVKAKEAEFWELGSEEIQRLRW